MYEALGKYLRDRAGASEEEAQAIFPYFKPLNVSRGAFLLQKGEVCSAYYFVNEGCIRIYDVNEAGEEATRYFAFEGSFGTALPSLITQQPAFEYVQAVEPSKLLVISRGDFYELVAHTRALAFVYRTILEAAFITAQERIYGFHHLSAIEKLRWLLAYQPRILTRLSNKMVASFLGVQPETLSRLKAQL